MVINVSDMKRSLFVAVIALFMIVSWTASGMAIDVSLQWDPNSESDLAGYRVYYKAAETFDSNEAVLAADVTCGIEGAIITGLDSSLSHSFVVTAYNQSNLESGYSNVVTVSASETSPVSTVSLPPATVEVINDVTPPDVSIISPANNSAVDGIVTVSSSVSDNVAVGRVEFYENGILRAAVNFPPYNYIWDTGNSANGPFTLAARAYDTMGNIAQAVLSVTVNNVTAVPEALPVLKRHKYLKRG